MLKKLIYNGDTVTYYIPDDVEVTYLDIAMSKIRMIQSRTDAREMIDHEWNISNEINEEKLRGLVLIGAQHDTSPSSQIYFERRFYIPGSKLMHLSVVDNSEV